MPVMPRRMYDGIDDYGVANDAEDDAVGKAARVGPPDLFATLSNAVKKGIARQPRHGFTRRLKKLTAQSRLLLVIPLFRFQQVGIHFRADDEAVFHSPSLRRKRE